MVPPATLRLQSNGGKNKSTTYFDGESSLFVLMLHLQLLVMKFVVLVLQIDSWH
jgi:hypothetical protein